MSTNPFDSFPLTTSSNTPGDRISNNPFVAEEPIKEEEDKKATIMSPRDLSILNDTKPREHPIQPPSDTVQFTGTKISL